jgi:exodeoxyribonuclease III
LPDFTIPTKEASVLDDSGFFWISVPSPDHRQVEAVPVRKYTLNAQPSVTTSGRIACYNVNGIRTAMKKSFPMWLKKCDADIVCLSELKIRRADLLKMGALFRLLESLGYKYRYFNTCEGRGTGYAGTAMLSRVRPSRVIYGIGNHAIDVEGRVITGVFPELVVVSAYAPTASLDGRFEKKKLDYDRTISTFLSQFKNRRLLYCGDLNIGNRLCDAYDYLQYPERRQTITSFLPAERARFHKLLEDSELNDVYEHFFPSPTQVQFTFFDYRENFKRTVPSKGLRLDYFLASNSLLERKGKLKITDIAVHHGERSSDHRPLVVTLNVPMIGHGGYTPSTYTTPVTTNAHHEPLSSLYSTPTREFAFAETTPQAETTDSNPNSEWIEIPPHLGGLYNGEVHRFDTHRQLENFLARQCTWAALTKSQITIPPYLWKHAARVLQTTTRQCITNSPQVVLEHLFAQGPEDFFGMTATHSSRESKENYLRFIDPSSPILVENDNSYIVAPASRNDVQYWCDKFAAFPIDVPWSLLLSLQMVPFFEEHKSDFGSRNLETQGVIFVDKTSGTSASYQLVFGNTGKRPTTPLLFVHYTSELDSPPLHNSTPDDGVKGYDTISPTVWKEIVAISDGIDPLYEHGIDELKQENFDSTRLNLASFIDEYNCSERGLASLSSLDINIYGRFLKEPQRVDTLATLLRVDSTGVAHSPRLPTIPEDIDELNVNNDIFTLSPTMGSDSDTVPFCAFTVEDQRQSEQILMDSGASLCVTNMEHLTNLFGREWVDKRLHTSGLLPSFRVASGSVVSALGKITLNIRHKEIFSASVTFYVLAKASVNFILGSNFLKKWGAALDYAVNAVTMNGGNIRIPYQKKKNPSRALINKLYTTQVTYIPPDHYRDITTSGYFFAQSGSPGETLLISPCPRSTSSPDCTAMRTLSKRKGDCVVVRMINNSQTGRFLPRGTLIGTAEIPEDDQLTGIISLGSTLAPNPTTVADHPVLEKNPDTTSDSIREPSSTFNNTNHLSGLAPNTLADEKPDDASDRRENSRAEARQFLDGILSEANGGNSTISENPADLDGGENNCNMIDGLPEKLDLDLDKMDITAEQLVKLKALLREFPDVWALRYKAVKPVTRFTAKLHLKPGSNPHIHHAPHRNPHMTNELRRMTDQMLDAKIIQRSQSDWCSRVILVPKKNKTYRFVIDLRTLNEKLENIAYPLPRMDQELDRLAGVTYMSSTDLASGFYCLPLHPDSQPLTAFSAPSSKDGNLFEFTRLVMGIKSAPSIFQAMMDTAFADMKADFILNFVDDILVYTISNDFNDHLAHLRKFLERVRKYNFSLHPEKTLLARRKMLFLGQICSPEGMQPNPAKVAAVEDLAAPKTVKQLRSVCGLFSYFRKYISRFAEVIEPLTRLLRDAKSKHAKISSRWTGEQEQAFKLLKHKLVTAPILSHPDWTNSFNITTDASKVGISGILTQIDSEGNEKVVAYASRATLPAEKNYATVELEALACVYALEVFKGYIMGSPVTLFSDHRSLKWLLKGKSTSRMMRWIARLAQFDFEIVHKAGEKIPHADCLSRMPVQDKDTCGPNNIELLAISVADRSSRTLQTIADCTCTACSELPDIMLVPPDIVPIAPADIFISGKRDQSCSFLPPYACCTSLLAPLTRSQRKKQERELHAEDITPASVGEKRKIDTPIVNDVRENNGNKRRKTTPISTSSGKRNSHIDIPTHSSKQPPALSGDIPTAHSRKSVKVQDPHKYRNDLLRSWTFTELGGNFDSSYTTRDTDREEAFCADLIGALKLASEDDPRTLKILHALREFDMHNRGDILLAKTRLKHVSRIADKWLVDSQDCLRYLEGERLLYYIPDSLRQVCLSQHHGLPLLHLGITKTLALLRTRFYWPGLTRDTTRWINACLPCKRRKTSRDMSAGVAVSYGATEPFSKIYIDLVGPFPTTKKGNRFVLTILDGFTRWPIAIPIPNRTAEVIATALYEHVFTLFSCPDIIVSDNGKELIGTVMSRVCDLLGIRKYSTTILAPNGNRVERFHRFMNANLAMICNRYGDDWDGVIPSVLFAYRISKCEATGVSPFEAIFAREPKLPLHLQLDFNFGKAGPRKLQGTPYVDHLVNTFKDIHSQMRLVQTKMANRNIDRQNRKARNYSEGEPVLLYEPHNYMNRRFSRDDPGQKGKHTAKLSFRFTGPHFIHSTASPNNCWIIHISDSGLIRHRKVHVNLLTRYRPWEDALPSVDTPLLSTENEIIDLGDAVDDDNFIEITQPPPRQGELVLIRLQSLSEDSMPFSVAKFLEYNDDDSLVIQWYGNTPDNVLLSHRPGWVDSLDNKHYYANRPNKRSHLPYTNGFSRTQILFSHVVRTKVILANGDHIPADLLQWLDKDPDTNFNIAK